MKILAIETTERIGTVALAEDCNILLQASLDASQRSAQSLAPALARLLDEAGWKASNVELVAVTVGPGSFTGLRVGVTTAKTFAYGVGAKILGIDTLEAIAVGIPEQYKHLAVAIDAQRGELAAAVLQRGEGDHFEWIEPMRLVNMDDWLAGLPEYVAVAGPIFYKRKDRLPEQLTLVPEQYWSPTAAAVARLAARDYAAGRRDDLWKLVPRYSRRSAAEEKRDGKA